MNLLGLALGLVAEGREIGNQAHVPEQQRHRRVGADREHVPQERAAEAGPHVEAARRQRKEPVGEPDAADVHRGEDPGTA